MKLHAFTLTELLVVLAILALVTALVAAGAPSMFERANLDQAARRACKPIDDKRGTIEYRTKVAGVLARRAATIAFARASERQ